MAKFPVDLEIHDRFSPSIWKDYEAVYEHSWKPEEGSLSFLRAIAEQEGEAGHLRMGIARSDGLAVAAQVWTVEKIGRTHVRTPVTNAQIVWRLLLKTLL